LLNASKTEGKIEKIKSTDSPNLKVHSEISSHLTTNILQQPFQDIRYIFKGNTNQKVFQEKKAKLQRITILVKVIATPYYRNIRKISRCLCKNTSRQFHCQIEDY